MKKKREFLNQISISTWLANVAKMDQISKAVRISHLCESLKFSTNLGCLGKSNTTYYEKTVHFEGFSRIISS